MGGLSVSKALCKSLNIAMRTISHKAWWYIGSVEMPLALGWLWMFLLCSIWWKAIEAILPLCSSWLRSFVVLLFDIRELLNADFLHHHNLHRFRLEKRPVWWDRKYSSAQISYERQFIDDIVPWYGFHMNEKCCWKKRYRTRQSSPKVFGHSWIQWWELLYRLRESK